MIKILKGNDLRNKSFRYGMIYRRISEENGLQQRFCKGMIYKIKVSEGNDLQNNILTKKILSQHFIYINTTPLMQQHL